MVEMDSKLSIYAIFPVILKDYTNSWGTMLMLRNVLWLRILARLKYTALICPRVDTVFEALIIAVKKFPNNVTRLEIGYG